MMSLATNSASPKWQLGPACCVDMLILEPVKDKSQRLHWVPPTHTVASLYLPPNGKIKFSTDGGGLQGTVGHLALDVASCRRQYM